MSLVFDKDSGVVVPETSEVREEIASETQDAFIVNQNDPLLNVDPTAPMGQMVDVITAEVEAKNAELAYLANMLNAETARGVWLDYIASWYFLQRKKSEPTVVHCVCTGLAGTQIPYGAYVKDGSGNMFRQSNNQGVTIGVNGTVETDFTCTERGAIVVGANSVNQIVTVVAGWDGVNNPTAGETGRIEETDTELRNRMAESVALNSYSSVSAIYSKVRATDGVLDAYVAENDTDNPKTVSGLSLSAHSVAVSVVGGDDEDIAIAIKASKCAGCGTTGDGTHTVSTTDSNGQVYTYNIVRPNPLTIKCQVNLLGSTTTSAEQDAVRKAIITDFEGNGNNAKVEIADKIYGSRFYPCVIANSSLPIASVKLSTNGGTTWADSATITILQSPTMSASDISFTFTP